MLVVVVRWWQFEIYAEEMVLGIFGITVSIFIMVVVIVEVVVLVVVTVVVVVVCGIDFDPVLSVVRFIV
jgi:hypothetical protein